MTDEQQEVSKEEIYFRVRAAYHLVSGILALAAPHVALKFFHPGATISDAEKLAVVGWGVLVAPFSVLSYAFSVGGAPSPLWHQLYVLLSVVHVASFTYGVGANIASLTTLGIVIAFAAFSLAHAEILSSKFIWSYVWRRRLWWKSNWTTLQNVVRLLQVACTGIGGAVVCTSPSLRSHIYGLPLSESTSSQLIWFGVGVYFFITSFSLLELDDRNAWRNYHVAVFIAGTYLSVTYASQFHSSTQSFFFHALNLLTALIFHLKKY